MLADGPAYPSGCVPDTAFAADGLRLTGAGFDVKWGPLGVELWRLVG